jgi:hypothetical protein
MSEAKKMASRFCAYMRQIPELAFVVDLLIRMVKEKGCWALGTALGSSGDWLSGNIQQMNRGGNPKNLLGPEVHAQYQKETPEPRQPGNNPEEGLPWSGILHKLINLLAGGAAVGLVVNYRNTISSWIKKNWKGIGFAAAAVVAGGVMFAPASIYSLVSASWATIATLAASAVGTTVMVVKFVKDTAVEVLGKITNVFSDFFDIIWRFLKGIFDWGLRFVMWTRSGFGRSVMVGSSFNMVTNIVSMLNPVECIITWDDPHRTYCLKYVAHVCRYIGYEQFDVYNQLHNQRFSLEKYQWLDKGLLEYVYGKCALVSDCGHYFHHMCQELENQPSRIKAMRHELGTQETSLCLKHAHMTVVQKVSGIYYIFNQAVYGQIDGMLLDILTVLQRVIDQLEQETTQPASTADRVRANQIVQNAVEPIVVFLDGVLRAMTKGSSFQDFLRRQPPNSRARQIYNRYFGVNTVQVQNILEQGLKQAPAYLQNTVNQMAGTRGAFYDFRLVYPWATVITNNAKENSKAVVGLFTQCPLTLFDHKGYFYCFLIKSFLNYCYNIQQVRAGLVHGDVDWYADKYARRKDTITATGVVIPKSEEQYWKKHCQPPSGTGMMVNTIKYETGVRLLGTTQEKWENNLMEAIQNRLDTYQLTWWNFQFPTKFKDRETEVFQKFHELYTQKSATPFGQEPTKDETEFFGNVFKRAEATKNARIEKKQRFTRISARLEELQQKQEQQEELTAMKEQIQAAYQVESTRLGEEIKELQPEQHISEEVKQWKRQEQQRLEKIKARQDQIKEAWSEQVVNWDQNIADHQSILKQEIKTVLEEENKEEEKDQPLRRAAADVFMASIYVTGTAVEFIANEALSFIHELHDLGFGME